jgi:hypothetical protein
MVKEAGSSGAHRAAAGEDAVIALNGIIYPGSHLIAVIHEHPQRVYSVESAPGKAWRSWKSCEGERD